MIVLLYNMCEYVAVYLYVSLLHRLRRESAATVTLPFNNPIEINAPFSVRLHSLNLSSNRFTINLMSLFFRLFSHQYFLTTCTNTNTPTNTQNHPSDTIGIFDQNRTKIKQSQFIRENRPTQCL